MFMSDFIFLYRIFPDFPNIKWDSKTSELDLANLFPKLTKDERVNLIEECKGVGIIEPCKYNDYTITFKGWMLWNNCKC